MRNKQRNSSIELLKCLAVILITISHALPRYGTSESTLDFNIAMSGGTSFFLYLFYYFGQLGNILFIVCSCWFLLDSNITKKEKIINIYFDTFSISVCWMISLKLLGNTISFSQTIRSLFPVLFNENWFICCYLLMYVIHTWINQLMNDFDKDTHRNIVVTMTILYSFLPIINAKAYYYNDLLGFIYIYFLVGYLKKYAALFMNRIKTNVILLLFSILGLLMQILICQQLGIRFEFFSHSMLIFCRFTNIFVVIFGVTLFNISNNYCFRNRIIDKFSSISLLVYLISENQLFNSTIKVSIWDKIYLKYGYHDIILMVLMFAFVLLLFSLVLANIYNLIFKRNVKFFCSKTRK